MSAPETSAPAPETPRPNGPARAFRVRLPDEIEALLQKVSDGATWDDVERELVERIASAGLGPIHLTEIGERVGPMIGKSPRIVTATLKACLEDAGEVSSVADDLDALVREAEERGEITRYHDRTGRPWIALRRGARREVWSARSEAVRSWLRRSYYEKRRRAPKPDALADAVALLATRAEFESPLAEITVRTAERDGRIWIDLADERGRAVEIGPDGWQVVNEPPVLFYRAPGTASLPEPVRGDPAAALARFAATFGLDRTQCVLALGWCLAALKPNIPYPVLVVSAEAGAGKTAFSDFLASLIDPRAPQLLPPPREERDLAITASKRAVVAIENVSSIPRDMSDSFCRIATTGGFATRKLYSDDEEAVFDARRPILFNGIGDVIRQDDLLDRALVLTLPALEDERRRTLADLGRELEKLRPTLFGALCDAIATGLRRLPEMPTRGWPRMADAAQWIEACWPALGTPGEFVAVYRNNRAEAAKDLAEGDPVARAITAALDAAPDGAIEGTAEKLRLELAAKVGLDPARSSAGWPESGRGFSQRLRRLAPTLRKLGFEVAFHRTGAERERRIRIVRVSGKHAGEFASVPSVASGPGAISCEIKDLGGAEGGRKTDATDANGFAADAKRTERGRNADATDANGPTSRNLRPPPDASKSSMDQGLERPPDGTDATDANSPASFSARRGKIVRGWL